MNKIIIVGVSPLVQRRSDVFYIEPLRERGYVVEHCDLSPCFYNYTRYSNIINVPYALTFKSLETFDEYLKSQDIKHSIFIVELLPVIELQPLFKLLRSKACYCIRINPNASDMSSDVLPVLTRIKKGCYRFSDFMSFPLRIFRRFFNKGKSDNFNYNIWSYYISSGKNPLIDFHINQDDWVKSRKKYKQVEGIPNKYAVFCDEYFPYHPDNECYEFGDIDSLAEQYYTLMNKYFDYLEQINDVKIIIAGHPKSNYKGYEFGGRPIIRFKTVELVRFSEFVVLHGSMSIAYAILFDKPISLVITSGLKSFPMMYMHQLQYSEYFQLPLYNISKDIKALPQRVSLGVKEKYIYDYLTTKGIEDKDNVDLLDELFSKEIPFT